MTAIKTPPPATTSGGKAIKGSPENTPVRGERQQASPMERARHYVDKIPGAVSGAGGHAQTFSAAVAVVNGFALPEAQALEILREYNGRCEPPWSEADLLHKVRSAARSVHSKPRGHLLGENVGHGQQNVRHALQAPEKSTIVELRPDRSGFTRGTPQDEQALAKLRNIGLAGIQYASERGVLVFGKWCGLECWGLTDCSGRVLEIRRLDGEKFPAHGNLNERKPHAVKGSNKRWPVGIIEARTYPKIALVEGMPDFLECHYATLVEGKHDVAPVAMLSCSPAIDEEALPMFAGKLVRIFAHAERQGAKGACKWAGQLKGAGATVEAFDFAGLKQRDGSPVNDFLDFSSVDPREITRHRAPLFILP